MYGKHCGPYVRFEARPPIEKVKFIGATIHGSKDPGGHTNIEEKRTERDSTTDLTGSDRAMTFEKRHRGRLRTAECAVASVRLTCDARENPGRSSHCENPIGMVGSSRRVNWRGHDGRPENRLVFERKSAAAPSSNVIRRPAKGRTEPWVFGRRGMGN